VGKMILRVREIVFGVAEMVSAVAKPVVSDLLCKCA